MRYENWWPHLWWSYLVVLSDFFCMRKQRSDVRCIFRISHSPSNPKTRLVIYQSIQVFWLVLLLSFIRSTLVRIHQLLLTIYENIDQTLYYLLYRQSTNTFLCGSWIRDLAPSCIWRVLYGAKIIAIAITIEAAIVIIAALFQSHS